jgi:hypothetical protein
MRSTGKQIYSREEEIILILIVSEVKVTLRLTLGQTVRLCLGPHLGLMAKF